MNKLEAFTDACESRDFTWLTDNVDSSEIYQWIHYGNITLSQFRTWLSAVEYEAGR